MSRTDLKLNALKPISLADRKPDRRSNILQEAGIYEDVVRLKSYLAEHGKLPVDGVRLDISHLVVADKAEKGPKGRKVYGSEYKGRPDGPLAGYTNPISSLLWRLRHFLEKERQRGLVYITSAGPVIDIWDAHKYHHREA